MKENTMIQKYNANMLVGDIVATNNRAIEILTDFGMGCMGCPASQAETLADAALVHDIDVNEILKELNK